MIPWLHSIQYTCLSTCVSVGSRARAARKNSKIIYFLAIWDDKRRWRWQHAHTHSHQQQRRAKKKHTHKHLRQARSEKNMACADLIIDFEWNTSLLSRGFDVFDISLFWREKICAFLLSHSITNSIHWQSLATKAQLNVANDSKLINRQKYMFQSKNMFFVLSQFHSTNICI